MPLRWVERFQIYVLNVGNLAAGASVVDLPLPLDSDAPFALRGRGGRCQNDPRYFQAGMNALSVRYRDNKDRFTSDYPVPWYVDVPGNGYGGQWAPVYPEKRWAARSSLLTSIYNAGPGAVDLTNLQLYYVGVKKYPASQEFNTFPAKFSVLPFDYCYWNKAPLNPTLPFQGALMPPTTAGKWDNIPLTIQNDADFCLLGGQAGIAGLTSAAPYFYMELFINLMDWQQKPYMSSPVHIDWLFGGGHQSMPLTENNYYVPNNSQSIFESYTAADAPWNGLYGPQSLSAGIFPGQTPLSGNWHPGLVFPQIYIPANQQLYFDLIRNDAGYTTAYGAGGGTTPITVPNINLNIAFKGLKVFHR